MKRKDIIISVILTIVTCGIYGIIWFININDDVKALSDDKTMPSGGLVFLLTLITCGIYGFYWVYRMAQLVNEARVKRNLPSKDNAILYIVLQIFGLGIVNYALIQTDINEMITE